MMTTQSALPNSYLLVNVNVYSEMDRIQDDPNIAAITLNSDSLILMKAIVKSARAADKSIRKQIGIPATELSVNFGHSAFYILDEDALDEIMGDDYWQVVETLPAELQSTEEPDFVRGWKIDVVPDDPTCISFETYNKWAGSTYKTEQIPFAALLKCCHLSRHGAQHE